MIDVILQENVETAYVQHILGRDPSPSWLKFKWIWNRKTDKADSKKTKRDMMLQMNKMN